MTSDSRITSDVGFFFFFFFFSSFFSPLCCHTGSLVKFHMGSLTVQSVSHLTYTSMPHEQYKVIVVLIIIIYHKFLKVRADYFPTPFQSLILQVIYVYKAVKSCLT